MINDVISKPDSGRAGRLAVWLATGLGVGLATPAPGTVGGLWGLLLVPVVAGIDPLGAQLAAVVALAIVGAIICTRAAATLGGSKDPQAIVLDEIVALPIVFIGVERLNWPAVVAGFLLFRLFDIWKPWPAPQAETLPQGWGIVADDCVAAVFGCLALHALVWVDRATGLSWLAA